MVKKQLIRGVAVSTVVLGSTIATPRPTLASSLSGCDAGEVCQYNWGGWNDRILDPDYRHQWLYDDGDYRNNDWYDVYRSRWTNETVDESVGSTWNSGQRCSVVVHSATWGAGSSVWITRGNGVAYYNGGPIGPNNVSSHSWCDEVPNRDAK